MIAGDRHVGVGMADEWTTRRDRLAEIIELLEFDVKCKTVPYGSDNGHMFPRARVMTIRCFVLLSTMLLAMACDRNTTDDAPPVATSPTETTVSPTSTTGGARPKPIEAPPAVKDPSGVDRHDELVVGRPRQHWIDVFGPSDSREQFFLKDGLLEYRVELNNVFRRDAPETENVEIYEDTWDEDGYTFVLWSFRRSPGDAWEAVQAMSYEDGIEF